MLHTVQLGQAAQRIGELGVAVLVIGPGDAGQAKWHARLIRAPFPVAGDPVRAIYEAYGLVRGAWTLQQSGTFLIDRDGVLRMVRRATNPTGALDMTGLMNAIAALPPR